MARAKHNPWAGETNGSAGRPLGRWLRDHVRVAAEALHHVSARLGTSLLVWLLVGIALALPSGLFLLQRNLDALSEDWQGRPGLTVYFEVGLPDDAVAEAAALLEREPAVATVATTSAAAALAEFEANTTVQNALRLLEENPLPASARATLEPTADVRELTRLAAKLGAERGVQEVVVEKTWLERLKGLSLVVQRLGWLLAALFGVGAVLVTATSVRLAIEARLDELKVQKLVGATDAQIRRPFLYFGALYGLGGAVVALMLISVALLVIEQPLAQLLGSYEEDLETVGFTPIFLLALLALGGALGVLGAVMAARQRLRQLEIL